MTGAPKGNRLVRIVRFVAFAAVATATAAYLHLRLSGIPDRDALYHFRHGSLYAQHGPFYAEFPWTTYSAISTLKADIWYGFHLLLAPFALFDDSIQGVKLAGVFCLSSLLILLYGAMRMTRMRLPFLWPFVIVAFTPFSLYRLLMTRPHVVTMGLTAMLLACAVSGSLAGIVLMSFAICFVHLGFFWIIPVVLGPLVLVRRATEESWAWRETGAALIGGLAGWLLRPHPIGAAKLAYVQIVELALEKQKGLELLFGSDLRRGLDAMQQLGSEFVLHFGPGIAMFAAAALIVIMASASGAKLRPRQWTLLWSVLALSAVELAVMMQFSIRAVDLWIVFAGMLLAATCTFLLHPRAAAETGFGGPRSLAAAIIAGLLLIGFMATRVGLEHSGKMQTATYSADRLKGAAEWLADESTPGEIVFHSHWDLFPDLFFWNTKNRYIGGMDPIFQYSFDRDLYWKAHHLYTGRFASYTCGTPHCAPQVGEGTFEVLRHDFRASYLVLEKRRHAALFAYASRDGRFTLGYDNGDIAVFRLEKGDGT
jgi:hypothetical protein